MEEINDSGPNIIVPRRIIEGFHIPVWIGRIPSREAERVYWETNIRNLSDSIERRMVLNLLSDPV